MARVERANVVLDVPDDEVQHYLTLGYNLTDENGNILKACVPTSISDLQAEYIKNTAKISQLEATIAELTAKLEAKEPKKRTTKKTEE